MSVSKIATKATLRLVGHLTMTTCGM